MNIEQIADAVSKEMLGNVATLQPELVKWNTEYLLRCLEKMAEHGVEPLYTETQLLSAQQRTAEACAELMESQHTWVTREAASALIRNGNWREYL